MRYAGNTAQLLKPQGYYSDQERVALYIVPSAGVGSDVTPDQFTFTDQSGVTRSATITSDAVTPVGYDTATTIAVSGDASSEYSINGGAYTSVAGTLSPGDYFTVRHTASASYLTSVFTVITLDSSVSDTFTSTTLIDPAYTTSGDGSINMGFGLGF